LIRTLGAQGWQLAGRLKAAAQKQRLGHRLAKVGRRGMAVQHGIDTLSSSESSAGCAAILHRLLERSAVAAPPQPSRYHHENEENGEAAHDPQHNAQS
jgi:hypothetical protein